jgi:hypothetical protein
VTPTGIRFPGRGRPVEFLADLLSSRFLRDSYGTGSRRPGRENPWVGNTALRGDATVSLVESCLFRLTKSRWCQPQLRMRLFKVESQLEVPSSSLKLQYKSTVRQRNASIGNLFELIGSYVSN